MKKTILIISISTFLIACSGSKTDSTGKTETNSTAETWEIVKAEGFMADSNVGTKYAFDGDKITMSGGGMKNEGTNSMNGDTLICTMKTYAGVLKFIKEMKGKQMILKGTDSDQVFYLEKK